MKQTQFYPYHLALGARMVPFAGFLMPLEYSGVNQEHINVREQVGIFDVSHMGEIWIKGPKAYDLVQRITSNDLAQLEAGKIQYSCLPNEQGGIVDDLLVYMFDRETYLLVVNASNLEKDHQWILRQNREGALVENASDQISQLAVQGPNAVALVQLITGMNLAEIPYYHFASGVVAGAEQVIVSNTGYTGAGGFELYLPNQDASRVWEALFGAGKALGVQPAGLAARDTLRLEMGFCLYGNDINDTTSPLEAGLGWITKFTPGNDFINRPGLEKQKAEGVSRRLVGFELVERGIPRQHYPIYNTDGVQIGEVTSGTMSPMLKRGIGMGYVEQPYAKTDTAIQIGIRNKQIAARIVKPPFYRPQVN